MAHGDPIARRPAAPSLVAHRTLRITLAYDGTDYAGWQIQRGPATIQGVLTAAARGLCGPDTRVTAASRTDAGVHALRQVASIRTNASLPAAAIMAALNAALPRDIRVRDAAEAPSAFDARRSAAGKRYAYLIDNARVPSPLLRRFAWHVPSPLDVDAMRTALGALRGRHDFSAFCASAGREKTPECAIRALHVFRRKQAVTLWISADRYLHHMVRTLVGSAVDIGRGARDPGFMAAALVSRDRRCAGPTAPAHGLTLVRVMYPR